MTYPHGGGGQIWRDGSGSAHKPLKSEIRDWSVAIEGFDTVAEMKLNTTPAFGVGTIWKAAGFRYVEAASTATDHHLTTAGGVKLYVQPGASGYALNAFGVVGDGVTDDTAAVQAAVKYCIENSVDLVGGPALIKTTGPIYIPQHTPLDKSCDLDFGGATFYPTTSGTLFESGSYSAGVWTSEYATASGGFNSFNLQIRNFNVYDGGSAMKLNNWHQGCRVENITMNETNTALDTNHCFYLRVKDVRAFSSNATWVDERFIFSGDTNLVSVTGCVAVNSAVGYKFTASSVADVTIEDNSIEGCTMGIEFTGIINNATIIQNYIENIPDVCFKFGNDARAVTVDNNYFNLNNAATSYIFEHTNSSVHQVFFGANNRVNNLYATANRFKNSGTTWGAFVWDDGNGIMNTLSDIERPTADYPYNTVFRGHRNFGYDEAVAQINRGIVPANYSGRTTRGYSLSNKLYGAEVLSSSATQVTYSTKIIYQERQLLFCGIRVTDGGYVAFNGLIMGNDFWEFGSGGFAKNANVVVTTDGSGFTQIQITGLTAYTGTFGAEVRVI